MKCSSCGFDMELCNLGGVCCPICDCMRCDFFEMCDEIDGGGNGKE